MHTSCILSNEKWLGIDLPAGGVFAVTPGSEQVIYAARSRNCSANQAPGYVQTIELAGADVEPTLGTLYGAGWGTRPSRGCNGQQVVARAIGIKINPDAPIGTETRICFFEADCVMIRVITGKKEREAN